MLTVLLRPLSAEHQYFPECFLSALNLSVFPVPTLSPFLLHVIFGTGLPMAAQRNVTVDCSLIVWSTGVVVKLGGSKT